MKKRGRVGEWRAVKKSYEMQEGEEIVVTIPESITARFQHRRR